MDAIDFSKIIPKYDYDNGGDVFANYMQLYQDFINEVIASNETIYSIFDVINCDSKYLPYMAAFLGYPWSYTADIEVQRYEMLSLVERRKRAGTLWFFEDMLTRMGISYETPRDLVEHILALSGQGTLSGDYYIEGIEKYHEGSIEIIINHAEIEGLYDTIKSSIPAGVHLHVTFTS